MHRRAALAVRSTIQRQGGSNCGGRAHAGCTQGTALQTAKPPAIRKTDGFAFSHACWWIRGASNPQWVVSPASPTEQHTNGQLTSGRESLDRLPERALVKIRLRRVS